MFDTTLLAESASLLPARLQMAFTLGFHIVLACFGVGMPILMLLAEHLAIRTDDPVWHQLARRWSKAFAVLFAVGAVSGTVLSFELGILWPGFMGTYGAVIGLPFTMEGFAFFIEAIFAGIYLYGWDRLPRRAHWWSGVPVAVSGALSAWFVVTANAWMNAPQGFEMEAGKVVAADPIKAMLNPATGAQTAHMIVAAYVVSGFCVAAFYAGRILRGDSNQYHRRAMGLGLLMGCIAAPLQGATGDWSAKVVAKTQPVKLAAMEGVFETEKGAPLLIGGIPNETTRETRMAIRIPKGLSFLAYGDWNAEVQGLNETPQEFWPPVTIVHIAFQIMVGIGAWLVAIAIISSIGWCFRRSILRNRWFLFAVVISGPLAAVALEAGWVVTEVGRQPWIVQGEMLTRQAVTEAPGVWNIFAITMLIYAVLLAGALLVLRRLAAIPLPEDCRGT